jgi:hypothetical protein
MRTLDTRRLSALLIGLAGLLVLLAAVHSIVVSLLQHSMLGETDLQC